MRAIGIDPGLNATGWAVVEADKGPIATGTVRPGKDDTNLYRKLLRIQVHLEIAISTYEPECLVVEQMQVRHGTQYDPQDLIPLSIITGIAFALRQQGAYIPTPTEWKGSVPKDIHHERLRKKLNFNERASKDALDAIGLAVWGLEQEGYSAIPV